MNPPVTEDEFFLLGRERWQRTPRFLLPRYFRNHGNYVISLGRVVKRLAQHAQSLGIEMYSGFAATEVLYGKQDRVIGIATGDMGVARDGRRTSAFAPGVELRGKYTVFAEGARGHLGRELIQHFDLAEGRDPVSFSIASKTTRSTHAIHRSFLHEWLVSADLIRHVDSR